MTEATNLQRIRISRGFSQGKLAKESGISVRMIQHYEQRRKDINGASAMTVYRLANALGCGCEDILEFEEVEGEPLRSS